MTSVVDLSHSVVQVKMRTHQEPKIRLFSANADDAPTLEPASQEQRIIDLGAARAHNTSQSKLFSAFNFLPKERGARYGCKSRGCSHAFELLPIVST